MERIEGMNAWAFKRGVAGDAFAAQMSLPLYSSYHGFPCR